MQREFQDPWVRRQIGNTDIHYAHGREHGNPMPLVRPEPGSFQIKETNKAAKSYHQGIHHLYTEHKDLKLRALKQTELQLDDILTTAVESGYVDIYSGLKGFLPPEAKPIIMQVLSDTMTLSASAAVEYENFLRNIQVNDAHDHVIDIISKTTSKIDKSIDHMWSLVNN